MTRIRITRAGSATAVMLMIAVCAAVLSFGALAEIGNSAARRVNLFGIEPPYAGYIWAATVDWFIILGFLNLEGPTRVNRLARVQIAIGLGGSLTFQLLHAAGVVVPIAVAATPVLAVFLSVESWALARSAACKEASVQTSEAGGRRPRQEREREAGPTTTPPAPAASSPRVRPRSSREVEAPAPGGPERATKSTPERDWSADLKSIERARLFREHATESKRSLIARAREAGVGATSERMSEEIDLIKTEGNGSAPEQPVEVIS